MASFPHKPVLASQLPLGPQCRYCTSCWLCGKIRGEIKWVCVPSPLSLLCGSQHLQGREVLHSSTSLHCCTICLGQNTFRCRWTCCFILRFVRTTQVMDSPSFSSCLESWVKEKVKLPFVPFLCFKYLNVKSVKTNKQTNRNLILRR